MNGATTAGTGSSPTGMPSSLRYQSSHEASANAPLTSDSQPGDRLTGPPVLTERLCIAVILTIAAIFRFWALGKQPFWLDEGYSWWDARQSLADLWRLVPQCDPHPPLYFVLLKGWAWLFGDGAWAMRALSASMGVATTGFVWLAGREIDWRAGLIAALLFALAPFQIEFAHEARPYTLLCLGAAVMLFGALRLTRREWNRSGAVAAGLGALIVLWANNTSVLLVASLVAGFGVLMLLDPQARRRWLPLAAVLAVVALLWLPYLPTMFEQARGVASDFWIQKPTGGRIANELRFVMSMSDVNAVWWAAALLAGGLLLLWRRGFWRQALLLASLALLPLLLNYAVSMTVRSIFIGRALIGTAPAIAVLMGAAVALLGMARWRRFTLAVLLIANGLALSEMYQNDHGKEPWDQIARQLAVAMKSDSAQNPVVLTVPNELVLPLGHAMEELNISLPVSGAPENFPSPGLTARYPSGKCAPSVAASDYGRLGRLIQGRRTIYFITRRNNVYDPGNGIDHFLTSHGLARAGTRTFMPGWLEVHKFVSAAPRRPPAPLASAAGPMHSAAGALHLHVEDRARIP